jgi:flavin reductase (DIM6/NTAB) family NADH-FMN oxidoreductase RutF
MSGDPPLLCLCIGSRAGEPKDTARNIVDRGEFVVNLVSENMAGRMTITSIDFDVGLNEAQEAGLEMLPSQQVAVPRIRSSPCSMECKVRQLIDIDGIRTFVLADIVGVHLCDEAVTDVSKMFIDPLPMALIGRLHSPGWYCKVSADFQLSTPSPQQWQALKDQGQAQQLLNWQVPAPTHSGGQDVEYK